MRHVTVRHAVAYSENRVHINTIEGFWALVKRAWYGTHHHCSEKRMGQYIAEAAWKYSQRKNPDPFGTLIAQIMGTPARVAQGLKVTLLFLSLIHI